jgi:hypothetical protein
VRHAADRFIGQSKTKKLSKQLKEANDKLNALTPLLGKCTLLCRSLFDALAALHKMGGATGGAPSERCSREAAGMRGAGKLTSSQPREGGALPPHALGAP